MQRGRFSGNITFCLSANFRRRYSPENQLADIFTVPSLEGKNYILSWQHTNEIVDLARMVEQEGISTAISSITTRADDPELSKRATEVNKILRKFCRQNDWGFIEHNNIVADKHLNRSRLHLNRAGTNLLSQNLLSYINSH